MKNNIFYVINNNYLVWYNIEKTSAHIAINKKCVNSLLNID